MVHAKSAIRIVILTTLLFANMTFLVAIGHSNVVAQQTTGVVIYVDPKLTKDLFAPSQFTVNVVIANITDFYGLDLQLAWDPTIIKHVSHQKQIPVETYPDGILHSPTIGVRDQVDETASMAGADPGTTYWLAEAAMLPAAPFDGTGIAVIITFEVVGNGTSPIKINAATLADSSGSPIEYTKIDGQFINFEAPPPPPPPAANIFVDPASVVNKNLTAGKNFTVSVNASKVTDLYSFEFQLNYNATLLDAIEVTANSMFPSPGITNTPGVLSVTGSLVAPPPFTGNLSLASIKFEVMAEGQTALDLNNVVLRNSTNAVLNATTPKDGYFNNMQIFAIEATVTMDPHALNLESIGKWIAAIIELPEGYNVSDIDISTILINETVPVDMSGPTSANDSSLEINFNRTQLIQYILTQKPDVKNETITLTISGALVSAVVFVGSGTVKVSPQIGDVNCDGIVNILDITLGGLAYKSKEGDMNWNPNANIAPEYDIINIFDLVTATAYYQIQVS